MPEFLDINSASEVRLGRDPRLDAWILHFMTENNLEYTLLPQYNASPEQLRFMVRLDEDQVYAPCSDEMFLSLLAPQPTATLLHSYNTSWRVLDRLITANLPEGHTRDKILEFCTLRFKSALSDHIMIPSRLMKRLVSIFLAQSGLEDPYRERKKLHNKRVSELVKSDAFEKLIYYCVSDKPVCGRLSDLRWELDLHELERLFLLSTFQGVWHGGDAIPKSEALLKEIAKPCPGIERLTDALGPGTQPGKKILFIPKSSGAVIFDILIIRTLLRLGHQVILALKEDFYFQNPTIWDVEHDPILAQALKGAYFIRERKITKNDLLRELRANQFVVISDGTMERLNLYRVSVTFARAWKEADLIIAKGPANVRRLIRTKHEFTRDIICFARDEVGQPMLHYRPKAESIRKFTEEDLREMAESIIDEMRAARAASKSVMFYSAIVGSIPNQTKAAIRVLNTFVAYLRERLEGTYIINPAEHFVPGMDGDDLMFMWERVQRSGLLNVWRFQTVHDIEKSFELMGEKPPAVWIGKDATYSTGCTKEMKIAMDMQARQPELQIIGPNASKFFRRREYGVGKYFEAGIEGG
jgi:uncharacterized protein with ATP-grasp and redox domains